MIRKFCNKFCVLYVFVITALACSFRANHSCSFVELKLFTSSYSTINGEIKIDNNSVTTSSTSFGIWKGHSSDKKCSSYSSDVYIDSYWKTSRTFSLLGDILSVIIVILFFLSRSNKFFTSYKLMTALSYLCCFLQGCTFFMLNGSACEGNLSIVKSIKDNNEAELEAGVVTTKGECWFSTGAKFDMAAVTFWLAVAIILTKELISTEKDGDKGRFDDNEDIALKRHA